MIAFATLVVLVISVRK
ncbi:hypothetical protein [Megasphaera elsdenii]